MNEAAMTNSTAGEGSRHSGFDCRAEPRAMLAAASVPELCTAATVQWALSNAGVHPTCNTEDDQFVIEMCTADDLLLRCIAERPSATLADVAAKAKLLRARLRGEGGGDSCIELLTESVLADVVALAGGEAGSAYGPR